ncbi:MAG TPA: hypothetical protein DIT04_07115 [Dysgonomonas sp.]|nr:hypothetical protein [Dysgonomonas sp.]
MKKYKNLLSESAVWNTVSEFIDPEGNITSAEGQSVITLSSSGIINDSWVRNADGQIRNKYVISKNSETHFTYVSHNPALGVQEGFYDVNRNYIFSKFAIQGTEMNGYEVIRRVEDVCYASGALYDGNKLINTWTAAMTLDKGG